MIALEFTNTIPVYCVCYAEDTLPLPLAVYKLVSRLWCPMRKNNELSYKCPIDYG